MYPASRLLSLGDVTQLSRLGGVGRRQLPLRLIGAIRSGLNAELYGKHATNPRPLGRPCCPNLPGLSLTGGSVRSLFACSAFFGRPEACSSVLRGRRSEVRILSPGSPKQRTCVAGKRESLFIVRFQRPPLATPRHPVTGDYGSRGIQADCEHIMAFVGIRVPPLFVSVCVEVLERFFECHGRDGCVG